MILRLGRYEIFDLMRLFYACHARIVNPLNMKKTSKISHIHSVLAKNNTKTMFFVIFLGM